MYLLSVGYLSVSSILFLLFWIKSPLNFIFIIAYFYSLWLSFKKIQEDISIDAIFLKKELIILIGFAIILTTISGVGGFTYQVFDHIFHNSKINDIVNLKLPTFYKTENRFPTYYFGYYLPIGFIIKTLGLKTISIPLYIWTFLGLFIGLSWLFYIVRKNFIKLILLFFASGLFSVAYTIFHNPSKIFSSGYISYSNMMLNYSGLIGNLLQVPNQVIPVLIVTPILLFELILNKNFDRPIHLIASVFFWSPFSFIALSLFYISIFLINKNWEVISKELSINFLITLLAFSPIIFYLGSINESLDKGFFTKYESNYLYKWVIFIGLEIWIYFAFIFKSKSNFKLPILISAIILSIIPIYKIGVGNDFCMRMSTPFLLIFFLGMVEYLLEVKSSKMYYLAVIFFLMGSITPIKIIGRAVMTFDLNGPQKIKYDKYANTYLALIKNYGEKNANQYLMSEDSLFEKYLLNKKQK